MRVDRFVRLCLGEAVRGLLGHRRTAAPAVAIIAVSLVVLGGFMLVSENLGSLLVRWRQQGHVQLFLDDGITEGRRDAISAELQGNEAVASYRFVSKEEAAERFRVDFYELGDLLGFLEDNPLPPSFVVTVKPAWRVEEGLLELADKWGALPGVDAVQYDLQIIRRLQVGVNAIRFAGALLGGAVLLAAVITTANVIRVLVVARRREIDVLRFVGATEGLVRGRFLAEGAIQGLLGSVIALVVLYGVYKLGVAYVGAGSDSFLALLPMQFFDLFLFLMLIGIGVAAGVVGAWLAFGPGSGLRR
ncbi:MAG: cell division protein FtsX [Acidobacteriota bacterium]